MPARLLAVPFPTVMSERVKPETGLMKVAVTETGELSLTWTSALAVAETLGATCWGAVPKAPLLFSVLADMTAGALASKARAKSRKVAFRTLAIYLPGALNGTAFQSAHSEIGEGH